MFLVGWRRRVDFGRHGAGIGFLGPRMWPKARSLHRAGSFPRLDRPAKRMMIILIRNIIQIQSLFVKGKIFLEIKNLMNCPST